MAFDIRLEVKGMKAGALVGHVLAFENWREDGGWLIFEDPDTGVNFALEPRLPLVRVNVTRCAAFGRQVFEELEAVFAGLEVRLLTGDARGPASWKQAHAAWRAANAEARDALERMGALEQVPMLPARTLEALWAWNYARAERQRRWPGVFVPRIVAICRRQTTETACVWTGFVRSILPEVDTVLVMALAAPDAKPVRWSDLAQHLVEGADDGRRWAGPTPQRVPDAVHDLVSRTTTDRTIRMLRFDELLEARSR